MPLALLAAALTLLCALLAVTPAAANGVPADLKTTDVSFRGDGGLLLHGTVVAPAGATGRLPGMVLVHGAGTGTPRTKLMVEAEEFARRGLAVLVYDKRSHGYSLFERSYAQLARDALGAVAALRAQPGVDAAKVGIWGLSEGGWVAPIAASRSADIAFVVLVGANSLRPLTQQTWAVAAGMRKAGISGSLVDRAEPNLYRALADGGMFPEPYYDPVPTLARVRQPVLGIWGVHDLLTPPRQSPPVFAEAFGLGGNRHHTFRFFAGADHAAHLTPDGGVTRLPELAPGYADLVGSWVHDVTSGRPPEAATSGPQPVQETWAVTPAPPAWWESAGVQVAALALLLVAFAGYPAVALARWLRRAVRRGRADLSRGALLPVSGNARLLSAGGLIVVAGSFSYLTYAVMTGAKLASPGPLVAGRPVIWLALQLLTVVCVLAAARVALAWRRERADVPLGERIRLGLLLAGGLVLVPWGLYWGLLLP
jgi:dienelactone hydrolase